MTREEFDRILKEEGIARQGLLDDLWRTSPLAHEALEEKRLRMAVNKFLGRHSVRDDE